MRLKKLQADVCNFFSAAHATSALPLLQLCCLGNVRRTLQDELLRHLRACGWTPVQDMPYQKDGVRRSLDIVVFDRSDSQPLCLIELIHQDARSAAPWAVTAGMELDYQLFRPEVPLMQVGVFTVLGKDGAHAEPHAEQAAADAGEEGLSFSRCLADWSARRHWQGSVTIATTGRQAFHDGAGTAIEGYVEYFVGIRKGHSAARAATRSASHRAVARVSA